MGQYCLMKKQLLLLTGLCGVFLVGFQSCNREHGADTTLYSFKLTQPDGTTPESGYALIYEKHLDPTTGYASLRIPISDTLRWDDDEIVISCNDDSTATSDDGKKVYLENSGFDLLGREITKEENKSGIYFKRRNDGQVYKNLKLD